MSTLLRKIVFGLTFNSCLFLLLMIGIQNSYKKSSVNFLINETVKLPIGFIVGTSFIGGSVLGGLLTTNLTNRK